MFAPCVFGSNGQYRIKFSTLCCFLICRQFVCVIGQQFLSPEEFYDGIQNNIFDAIIDVRTLGEWNQGHIQNATFVENLSTQTSIPIDIQGCEGACRTIVVYCRSGSRAGAAIDLMVSNGFNGTIYNGRGTSQWTAAGYDLVTSDSVNAKCSIGVDTAIPCETNATTSSPLMMKSELPSSPPTIVPSGMPTTIKHPSMFPTLTPKSELPSSPPTIVPSDKPTTIKHPSMFPTLTPTSELLSRHPTTGNLNSSTPSGTPTNIKNSMESTTPIQTNSSPPSRKHGQIEDDDKDQTSSSGEFHQHTLCIILLLPILNIFFR